MINSLALLQFLWPLEVPTAPEHPEKYKVICDTRYYYCYNTKTPSRETLYHTSLSYPLLLHKMYPYQNQVTLKRTLLVPITYWKSLRPCFTRLTKLSLQEKQKKITQLEKLVLRPEQKVKTFYV